MSCPTKFELNLINNFCAKAQKLLNPLETRTQQEFNGAWLKVNHVWRGSQWVGPSNLSSIQLAVCLQICRNFSINQRPNKANLRDLIAATSLVILLKLDSNRQFFSLCEIEIWPRKIIGHLFYITSSFVHHLKLLGEFKLELLSGNAQFGSK